MNQVTCLLPWLQSPLEKLAQQQGHAFLLHGQSGLGQFELGLALAQAFLCENKTTPGLACGHCPGCHTVQVHTHPDLRVLMPETLALAQGWPLPEKAAQELEEKKRKPSQEIRVEALRDAVEWAQHTSARGQGLVLLVYPTEAMNSISSNTLLKTLEEPPGQARFILVSDALHQLLPTVRSRCQTQAIPWPTHTEALAWLENQGLAREQAQGLLRVAGGRPEDALALRDAPFAQDKAWRSLPKALARGDTAGLALLKACAPSQWLVIFQKICHDLWLFKTGATPLFFEAQDLPPAPSHGVLLRWSKQLLSAARTAQHPFQANLMFDAFCAQAQLALNPSA